MTLMTDYHPAQRSYGFSPWMGEYPLRSRLSADHFEMLIIFIVARNGPQTIKQSNTEAAYQSYRLKQIFN